jgi:vitamin B12 transporter
MTKIKLSILASALLVSSLGANDFASATVYSATKSEQSIKDVTSNVNVITAEDIEERRYTTVVEALNSLAGISFTSNGGLGKSASVRLRGMDSKRVLVVIDGIRYNDPTGLNGAPFEHLQIENIKRIEVIKGAQSGIWGADATAGVINIITKDQKQGTKATVSLEYGSFNTKKYGIDISHKEDSYYMSLSSHKVDSDGFTAQAPRGTNIDNYEDDGYKNTTTTIKFGKKLDDLNKIDISHTIIDATSEYDKDIYVGVYPNSYKDETLSANSYATSTTKDTFSKINLNHIDSFGNANIYVNKSIFNRDYSNGREYDGEVLEYGINEKVSYNTNDFVIFGIDYKNFEHKNSINKDYSNKAIFVTNSNEIDGLIAGKTIITQSLRKDNFDKFENKTTGKIGIKHFHENIKDLTTSINYGTAYNVPTLYNLYSSYGNENLTPEYTKSFDISAKYKDIKLTYFNQKIDDMIGSDSSYKYINIIGTSTIKGYELEYTKDITDEIFVAVNYTNLSAKDKDSYELSRRPDETLKLSMDYYGIAKTHINFNSEYIGDRIDYDYGTHNIKARTGKYVVSNLVVNYDLDSSKKVYLKIDNITDKYYQTVDGYATSPRAFYVGMKASF